MTKLCKYITPNDLNNIHTIYTLNEVSSNVVLFVPMPSKSNDLEGIGCSLKTLKINQHIQVYRYT